MPEDNKRYIGWGYKGRPFSRKEFKNSFLKQRSEKFSYEDYLKEIARQKMGEDKLKGGVEKVKENLSQKKTKKPEKPKQKVKQKLGNQNPYVPSFDNLMKM